MKSVTIFTDGACSGNPGPGGYGIIIKYGDMKREISRGFKKTTNNRMELHAVIAALSALKEPCKVLLYSDSKYIVDAVTKGWARRWQQNNWKRNKREYALNSDLWEQLLSLLDIHNVEMRWVRGHSGHIENEIADRLAVKATSEENLFDDL
jgi:ribonuclease HI